MIKAYLIDLDGTLGANEPPKGRAFADACRRFGAWIDPMIYSEVMGQG